MGVIFLGSMRVKGDKMEGPVDISQIRPFSIYPNSFPGRHSMIFLVFFFE